MDAWSRLVDTCQKKGWEVLDRHEWVGIKSEKGVLQWKKEWPDGLISLTADGNHTFINKVFPLCLDYLRSESGKKGFPGLWIRKTLMIMGTDTSNPDVCKLDVSDYAPIHFAKARLEPWNRRIKRRAFIPSGIEEGVKMLTQWNRLVPILREVEKREKEQDPLFYLASPDDHMDSLLIDQLRVDQEISFLYHKGGVYHPLVFHLEREVSVMEKGEKHSFFTKDEGVDVIRKVIQERERGMSLKRLLSLPQTHYKRRINENGLEPVGEHIYAYLKARSSPEEIEVCMRECQLSIYSVPRNRDNDLYKLFGVFNSYIAVSFDASNHPTILYMGEDLGESIKQFPVEVANDMSFLRGISDVQKTRVKNVQEVIRPKG